MPVSEKGLRLWKLTGYEPHSEAQWDYHRSDGRFKIPACGRRFGKSMMVEKDWLPELFDRENPGRYWMVALSYDTCDEFQFLWDDVIVKLGLGIAPGLKKANNARTGEMFIEFPWGTRVDVKSAMKPATLVGKGLKRAVLSEAAKMPEIIWKKYISPALADWHGGCDMPSTPEGFNWYYQEHLRGLDGGDPNYVSWNFPSWENKVLFPRGFDDPEIQRQLPKDHNGKPIEDPWFWQEIGAEFRTLAGLIYPEFNRKVHVKKLTYDPAIPNYLAFDFGYNGFVALDCMVTPSGEVRVWRQYFEAEQPVHIHAEELKIRNNPEGYSVRCGFGDAADPDAVSTIGRKLVRVVARQEAKDVKAGIRAVKERLRPPNDSPRLFVDPSCVDVIREYESYRRKTPRLTTPDMEIKEEPLKKNDHTMDALRYLIMHLFKLGAAVDLSDPSLWSATEGDRGIFTMREDETTRLKEGITTGKVL